jgi:hypothetical protein
VQIEILHLAHVNGSPSNGVPGWWRLVIDNRFHGSQSTIA